ncbi:TPA: hypothetical protein KD853_004769 [Vibrio parahaemolyticus]|uniref:hypothetical protein n=1 Tax=Vibrio TaxID=662 RepID=UPI00046E6860|nr:MULTISPECIES: hypothetical protein [Vibrio]EJF7266466.1 hypothetical protein [Vibrio parahaemolyticus]MDG2647924.1 hypothetical protein [Vibrio parahaemolyticus]PME69302.1 hypothetical protein BCV31_21185 [Vibrio cyclitrophicus]HAS6475690.1 hypothetical protein [Vibrio parahaemolyticus]HBC3931591.1 hypothetical protein [Vibrio parahaemolyticus]
MFIAPNFSSQDWSNLDLDNSENDWNIAVDALKARLFERYISPVDLLIEAESQVNPQDKRFGFTTLAIDFLLMETFQAFKDGEVNSKNKSQKLFKKFLQQSPTFSQYFSSNNQRKRFYEQFRCGILHQAEVQSSALVWSVGDLYDRTGVKHTVNRLYVHRELKKEISEYLNKLRDPDSVVLREAFRKKMDSIAARGE